MPHDLRSFEDWLAATACTLPVADWVVDGLQVWPVLNTCLVNLATQLRMGHAVGRMRIGDPVWKAGVIADAAVVARLRRLQPRPDVSASLPRLDDQILFHGSTVQSRLIGSCLVTAPLDVPAMMLRRAGHKSVLWLEDARTGHPLLATVLEGPAFGVLDIWRSARRRAHRQSSGRALARLPHYAAAIDAAARLLSLSPGFLRLWITRQVNLALGSRDSHAEVFDRIGLPKLIVLVNSGAASTGGLTAAARQRGVSVVEVQHGALSRSGIMIMRRGPHFSEFNTAPSHFLTWDVSRTADPRVLATGPMSVLFSDVLAAERATPGSRHAELQQALQRGTAELAAHASEAAATREVLVSLQPGDDASWLSPFVAALPSTTLFWVRRHGGHMSQSLPAEIAACGNVESTLATHTSLEALLGRVDAHLTRFSSVVLEAATVGVPSLAIEDYAKDLFGGVVGPDLLVVAADRGVAVGQLEHMLKAPKRQTDISRVLPPVVAYLEACIAARVAGPV